MNTLRNSLKRSYSQIPNELITDMSLSHGELRVLLYLFTKPDDWNVYNKDICNNLMISEQTLTKYWKNLINSKWLRRETSRDKDGKLTGGYDYRIGNFTESIESTEPVKSIDHSNTKPINKQVSNTKSEYDSFIDELKELAKIPSKVTKTKEGKKLFKNIDDKQKFIRDYMLHQEQKNEYAQRITNFMQDYIKRQEELKEESKPRIIYN